MNVYRYIFISLALMLLDIEISSAQTYSLIPNDTILITGAMEDLETLTISQLNISTDTITLKWKKLSESVPSNWESAICDNQICYTSLVGDGTMNPVIPGDKGFLLLHLTPHVSYGTAVVRYSVWDIEYPALQDTLTFILTVNNPSGISEAGNKNAFRIFPNPVKGNINIHSTLKEGFQYIINDISGKQIQAGISKANLISVSTENFTDGVYSILISDNNKTIHLKKIVVQH
jgi:hypothetical protein